MSEASGLSQPRRSGANPPVMIRPVPPRARSRDVRRERRQVADPVLEPGVHRAHHHAVAQGQVAERDRLEEVRVAHPRH